MLSGRQLHAHVQVVVVASSCSSIIPLSFASPPARSQSVVIFSSVMGGSYFSLFKVTHKFDSCCAKLGNCLAKWPRDFSGTCHIPVALVPPVVSVSCSTVLLVPSSCFPLSTATVM